MQKREKGQIVQLKLRIRESLRSRIEKDAKRSGISLNAEMERRLEASHAIEDARAELEALRARIEEADRELTADKTTLDAQLARIRADITDMKKRLGDLRGGRK
jgi:chromosome segregation ATPase